MAKITITIEDLPNGSVKVAADPTFETMMNMHLAGAPFTAAHGYAFKALNTIRNSSKENRLMRVGIPRIR